MKWEGRAGSGSGNAYRQTFSTRSPAISHLTNHLKRARTTLWDMYQQFRVSHKSSKGHHQRGCRERSVPAGCGCPASFSPLASRRRRWQTTCENPWAIVSNVFNSKEGCDTMNKYCVTSIYQEKASQIHARHHAPTRENCPGHAYFE